MLCPRKHVDSELAIFGLAQYVKHGFTYSVCHRQGLIQALKHYDSIINIGSANDECRAGKVGDNAECCAVAGCHFMYFTVSNQVVIERHEIFAAGLALRMVGCRSFPPRAILDNYKIIEVAGEAHHVAYARGNALRFVPQCRNCKMPREDWVGIYKD